MTQASQTRHILNGASNNVNALFDWCYNLNPGVTMTFTPVLNNLSDPEASEFSTRVTTTPTQLKLNVKSVFMEGPWTYDIKI